MKGRRTRQTAVGLLAVLLLIGGMVGCATANDDVLPPSLQDRLAAEATADDYLEAARLYEAQADALKSKAARLENRAEAFQGRPYLDPKGLKRNSLRRLADNYRIQARGMEQQYAIYRAKARTFLTHGDGDGAERSGS